jgi:pyridoxamine 5'-phosphate oxidase
VPDTRGGQAHSERGGPGSTNRAGDDRSPRLGGGAGPALDVGEPRDPLARFAEVFERAISSGIKNPNAMALTTVAADGAPSTRQVLLKHFDQDGFVFYTNLESRKGRQLAADPRACLNFYWRELGRQVIVEGRVEPVSDEEADAYFASRDRGSQIGAWASRQSRPLESMAALAREVAAMDREHSGRDVPRPPFWSGFRLVPRYFEFWTEGPARLHDRVAFERDASGWRAWRLYP